jgi:hypothetical protein
MTWARLNEPENETVIVQAYNKIGRELGATVARVGPAWERVLDEKPSIKLHMEDRSHPTPAGTYLAACVFYATLLNDSPVGLPATLQLPNGKTLGVSPEDAKVLQKAAERVAVSHLKIELLTYFGAACISLALSSIASNSGVLPIGTSRRFARCFPLR